jgi:hypothetical protein
MSTPTSTCHLLNLPRELRNEIYRYYLHQDEGYYRNPRTDKLRQADGGPIDLALSYTCKQIASEMIGMAFELNAITCKTSRADPDCIEQQGSWHSLSPAGRYNYLLKRLYCVKDEAFTAAASTYAK